MNRSDAGNAAAEIDFETLVQQLDAAITDLHDSEFNAKIGKLYPVFATVRQILLQPDGCQAIQDRAERLEKSGVFLGSDWGEPGTLRAQLTPYSLQSIETDTVLVEVMSELRLLAVAMGDYLHESMSAEQAHHYLTQVLAINMQLLFGGSSETEREQGTLALISRSVLQHIAARIGYEHVIDDLIAEIWRIL